MNKLRTSATILMLASFTTGASAAVLQHNYQLNGNLEDTLGGPALVADGGTLGSDSYSFGDNKGLTLSNGLTDGGSYSIALNFNLSSLSGDRLQKIVDFKNLSSNYGVYTYMSDLFFYPGWVGSTSHSGLKANTNYEVVLTRDGNTKAFTAYVDGVKQGSFLDNNGYAVFSSSGKTMHFFEDDPLGADYGTSPGVVNSIRIWDGALSASEVAQINAVPLPGTFWLLGSALVGLGLLDRRRTA